METTREDFPQDDLRIENRTILSLRPYARNARTHSSKQIRQIARSIEEFGFTNPVLIDREGGIIAGHGRVTLGETSRGDVVQKEIANNHWKICSPTRHEKERPAPGHMINTGGVGMRDPQQGDYPRRLVPARETWVPG